MTIQPDSQRLSDKAARTLSRLVVARVKADEHRQQGNTLHQWLYATKAWWYRLRFGDLTDDSDED